MVTFDSLKDAFLSKIGNIGLTSEDLFINLLIAFILIVLGVFLGKLVKFGLRKLLEKIKIEKILKPSFIELFLVVVKWSIYILFINFALMQLKMPLLTNWLTTILGAIPALTGALVIISIGFAISIFLKEVIEGSKIDGWKILSQIFFYFINYVFIIFALRTALISIKDPLLSNILLIVLTCFGGASLIIYYFKERT